MYYSYVMGIGESIYELQDCGFQVEKDNGSNYMISFDEDKAKQWEEFIQQNLELGYWNEYLAGNKTVFIFRLDDGFKRYVVKEYENDEVLHLCEQLCECKIESIKGMLQGNHFYKDKIK